MTQDNSVFSYTKDPWIPESETQDVRIRLIELEPIGTKGKGKNKKTPSKTNVQANPGPLSCRIFWTSLNEPTPFKALSYTWGKPSFTQEITVNGKAFFITESLETALQHLRHPTQPVTLWIDQLCINQSNDEEKAEQVGKMSEIYRAAKEVLVWLGPAVDHSEEFMEAWKTTGKWAEDWGMLGYYTKEGLHIIQNIMNRVDPQDPKTIEGTEMVQRAMPLFTLKVMEGLAAWYARPWFKRVWVLQEYGLADCVKFVWGNKSVTADQAVLASQILGYGMSHREWVWSEEEKLRGMALMAQHDPTHTFFAVRNHRRLQDAGQRHGDSLYELLQKSFVENKLAATLPCDTVYGLMGIADDATSLAIPVDYTLKDKPELVYARTARAIIQNGDLDILALAQHPKVVSNVPSWVPDWTSTLEKSFAHQARREEARFFSASKSVPIELVDTQDELMLGLKGYKVDEIEEVAGIWDGAPDTYTAKSVQHEAHIAFFAQVRILCLLSECKGKSIYASSSRRKEAVWRIPIGDIEEGRPLHNAVRATHDFEEAYKVLLESMEFHEQWKAMPDNEFYAKKRERVPFYLSDEPINYRSCMTRMKNKRPFMTKDGYVGLGPRYMHPGDLVVVFCGGTLPYIIRPVGGGLFHFIGECYCDGIMDGEIVGAREKEEFYLV